MPMNCGLFCYYHVPLSCMLALTPGVPLSVACLAGMFEPCNSFPVKDEKTRHLAEIEILRIVGRCFFFICEIRKVLLQDVPF